MQQNQVWDIHSHILLQTVAKYRGGLLPTTRALDKKKKKKTEVILKLFWLFLSWKQRTIDERSLFTLIAGHFCLLLNESRRVLTISHNSRVASQNVSVKLVQPAVQA